MNTQLDEIEQKIHARDMRDELIIAGIAQGKSISQISNELGISRSTAYMVIDSPWGQNRLTEVVSDIRQAVNLKLPKLTALALLKMEDVLKGRVGNETAKTYVSASKVIFDLATKLSELSIKESKLDSIKDINSAV